MTNTFFCPWDKTNRVMTLISTPLILAAIVAMGAELIFDTLPQGTWAVLTVSLYLMVGCCAAAVSFSPRRVEVTDTQVIIRCIGWVKRIERRDLIAAQPFSSARSLRICGCGGFFGYLWWFTSPGTGIYFSYSVHSGQQTLLVTTRGKYVVSCEERERFIALLSRPS